MSPMATDTITPPDHTHHGTTDRPAATDREAELVSWAGELGAQIAPHAAGHDRDGTFVTEAFDLLRSPGYLALAVPDELGGRGATIREVAMAQRELATSAARRRWPRRCTSTSRCSRRGGTGAACPAPRPRCGGSPTRGSCSCPPAAPTSPTPAARPSPVDGGYRVSGRKIFASQSPSAT